MKIGSYLLPNIYNVINENPVEIMCIYISGKYTINWLSKWQRQRRAQMFENLVWYNKILDIVVNCMSFSIHIPIANSGTYVCLYLLIWLKIAYNVYHIHTHTRYSWGYFTGTRLKHPVDTPNKYEERLLLLHREI